MSSTSTAFTVEGLRATLRDFISLTERAIALTTSDDRYFYVVGPVKDALGYLAEEGMGDLAIASGDLG
jgi:hypothetical protein